MDFLAILSVTLTTLGLLFIGSIARSLRSKRPTTFRKKIIIFPLFVAGIFIAGFLTERVQAGVHTYLQQNVVTSLSGIAIALVITWVLYDWVIWRKR